MMGMQVGVFPAVKGEDGEWRFIVSEIGNDFRDSKRMIFGTEPEEDGMREPKFTGVSRQTIRHLPCTGG